MGFEPRGGGVAGGAGGEGLGEGDGAGGGGVEGGDLEVDVGGEVAGGFELDAGGTVGDGGLDPPLPPHAERKPAPANARKSRRLMLSFMAFFLNHAFWVRAPSAPVAASMFKALLIRINASPTARSSKNQTAV